MVTTKRYRGGQSTGRGAILAVGAALVLLGAPRLVHAQGIHAAQRMFEQREYPRAALAFYDIMASEANPEMRDRAQVYLAETMRRMNLWAPALFYYRNIFELGRQNRYYLNAVEGLLDIQRESHDPVLIPTLLSAYLDNAGMSQLDPLKISDINYMVGELSYRQQRDVEAVAFLREIPNDSPRYPHANYLLGLLALRANDATEALHRFDRVILHISEAKPSPERKRLRDLAILAMARAEYGAGRYREASTHYKRVPMFSDFWFNALVENAWALFQQGEYGMALGELQSASAPYFSKRHLPEANVIAATTFFANCQWDRVRREVRDFQTTYGPMLEALKGYLASERSGADIYRDLLEGGAGHYPLEIARDVRRVKRFKDFYFMVQHIEWERRVAPRVPAWRGTELAQVAGEVIDAQGAELLAAVGAWVQTQLQNRLNALQNFQNQINILDFEVTDAERVWLEQGQEILKGRRARLPRPKIPSDQWQHWEFDSEYWRDELGYIQHTIATECFESGAEKSAN